MKLLYPLELIHRLVWQVPTMKLIDFFLAKQNQLVNYEGVKEHIFWLINRYLKIII